MLGLYGREVDLFHSCFIFDIFSFPGTPPPKKKWEYYWLYISTILTLIECGNKTPVK